MTMRPSVSAAAEEEDDLLSAGAAPLSEINITPFVDVMLVLLIVFMVTAPLMMVGVNVSMPRSAAASVQTRRDPVVLSLDRDGRIYLGSETVEAEALPSRLRALAAEGGADQTVYLRADQTLSYARVMELMGVISSAGISRVSLLAAQARPPG